MSKPSKKIMDACDEVIEVGHCPEESCRVCPFKYEQAVGNIPQSDGCLGHFDFMEDEKYAKKWFKLWKEKYSTKQLEFEF